MASTPRILGPTLPSAAILCPSQFMEDELVLLTSYFNLVGGRRQDTADTFRVDTDLQSASSPDGTAALYILTEASTGGHMGPRARRLVADTVAWEYSSHPDEQPVARLKAALRVAHDELLREFDGHVAVGASVIAVEHDTVYLAQTAPAQVYVMHDNSLHSLPALTEGSSPFARSLGSRTAPTISVFRDTIGAGDVIALCSTWFDRTADSDDVRECFAGSTADDIAEALLDLAKAHDVRDATAIVIESASADQVQSRDDGEDRPAGFMEQVDVAVQALADVTRMLLSELRPVPSSEIPSSNGSSGTPDVKPRERGSGAHSITSEVPLIDEEDPAGADFETGEHPIVPSRDGSATTEHPVIGSDWPSDGYESGLSTPPEETRSEPSLSDQLTEEIPAVPAEPPPRSARPVRQPDPVSELDEVNSRLGATQDMSDVIPPVQAFEEAASTEPQRIYATNNKDIDAVNRRPRRFGGLGATPVIRPGLDIDLRKPMARATPPALIWGSVAVILVLAVAGLAVFVLHHSSPHTNPYPAAVAADLRKAQNAKNPGQQDGFLNKAAKDINLAAQNGSTGAAVTSMRQELRQTGDKLHRITRVNSPVLITDFARFPGAAPTQIASVPGSVFVLDPGRKSVFSVRAQPNQNPAQVAVAGDQYSGFTLGTPQLLATTGTTAYALDSNNLLLRDVAGSRTATSLSSGTQTQTPKYTSMFATPDGSVFLLDPSGDQVWRFPGGAPPPATYWDTNPPTLKDAVSLAFDSSDLYILKSAGRVLKYDLANVPQPHQFSSNLTTPLRHPTALYTDANQKYVWIADPANKRIVQLGKDGTHSRTYLSSGSMDLSKLHGMTVGPAGNTIYVMAGSKLYDFPVTP